MNQFIPQESYWAANDLPYVDALSYDRSCPDSRLKYLPLIALLLIAAAIAFPKLSQLISKWEAQSTLGSGPFAQIQLPTNVPEGELGSWQLEGFSANQKTLFYRLLASGRVEARPYLISAAAQVKIKLVDNADDICKAVRASCVVTEPNADGLSWKTDTLYLRRDHLAANAGSRFVFWHELGHIIDNQGLDYQTMAQWSQKMPKNIQDHETHQKLPSAELWAEQFALWALKTNKSLTGYQAPRLMSDQDMRILLARYNPHLTPLETRTGQ